MTSPMIPPSSTNAAFICKQSKPLTLMEESLSLAFLSSAVEQSEFCAMTLPLHDMPPVSGDPIQAEAQTRATQLHSVDEQLAVKIDAASQRLETHNAEVQKKIKALEQHKLTLGSSLRAPSDIQFHKRRIDAQIAQLQAQLKPPLAFHALMSKIIALLASPPSPSYDDDKKTQIEAVRKESGLSAGEMRGLFTDRIREVYRDSAKRLETVQNGMAAETSVQGNLATSYGAPLFCGATQNFYAGIKTIGDKCAVQAEIKRLQGVRDFASSLYPPPRKKGFWGKLKRGFCKIGQGLKKIGQVLKNAGTALKSAGTFIWRSVQTLPYPSALRSLLTRF